MLLKDIQSMKAVINSFSCALDDIVTALSDASTALEKYQEIQEAKKNDD